MLVSNAVIAQTKCRSAAVDEEETGSRQGAPAAAGEGRGGGSVSLTRARQGLVHVWMAHLLVAR